MDREVADADDQKVGIRARSLLPLIEAMRAQLDLGSDFVGSRLPTREDRMILSNWKRLKDDADYLANDKRYPTAFSVALLALEEVGKLIWRRWEADGMKPKVAGTAHRKKQLAVSAVGLAYAYLHVLKDHKGDVEAAEWNGPVWDALVASGGGYLWSVSSYTADGAWDGQKKVGFYEDPDEVLGTGVLAREEVTERHVGEVLTHATIALGGLLDAKAVRFAPHFLPVLADTERWEAYAAVRDEEDEADPQP
jgi:AbiV family abortive infection protein